MNKETSEPLNQKQYGKIYGDRCLLLRKSIGGATATVKEKEYNFDFCVSIPGDSPVVRCKETEKTFVLTWEDILNLAEVAGVMEAEDA